MPVRPVAAAASTRPCASDIVSRPLNAERKTAKPFSTPRMMAMRAWIQPSRPKSLAGTIMSRTPCEAVPRTEPGKSMSLQIWVAYPFPRSPGLRPGTSVSRGRSGWRLA